MSKRLLIVDDEPRLLRSVAACLREEGFEVLTARSALDALMILARTVPDLIISDIHMPHMDGYAFVRHVRAAERTALVPVVFLTAKDQKEDRIMGFHAGVDAYIAKPFEPAELLAVITAIFNRIERTRTQLARLFISLEERSDPQFQDEELTEAESRIAEAVASGLTNKEIASQFGISVRTVENHVSHILLKKGFNNRVEIARYVIESESGK
ncbi:MAG: response regulator transcription factor [Acidobacteriota bacterium]